MASTITQSDSSTDASVGFQNPNRIYVRKADVGDIEWIFEQTSAFYSQLDYQNEYVEHGGGRLRDLITDLIVNGVCFVTYKSKEQTGVILGKIYPYPLNPRQTVLGLWVWWVPEQFRGTRSGYLLLKSFVDAGKGIADVTVLSLRDVTQVPDEALAHFGLFLKEKTYVRENDRAKDGVIEDDRYDDTDDSGGRDSISNDSRRDVVTDDIGTIDRRY